MRTNFGFSKGRNKRRVSMKSLFSSTILVTIFYFFVLWHSKFLSRSLWNHWKYYWENNRKYQWGNHWKYYVAFHLLWHASTVTGTMCVLRCMCCAGPNIMVRLASLLWYVWSRRWFNTVGTWWKPCFLLLNLVAWN